MSDEKRQFTAEIYPPEEFSQEKLDIVGEVPVLAQPGGKVIGTAKMEKLKSGAVVAHVEMSPGQEHLISVGFKLGDFSFAEKD